MKVEELISLARLSRYKKGIFLCGQEFTEGVVVDCSSLRTARQLLTSLLDALGAPYPESATLYQLEERAVGALLGAEVVVLRDFDGLLSGRSARRVLAYLKSLLNRSRAVFVLTGRGESWRVIKSQEQLFRRFTPVDCG